MASIFHDADRANDPCDNPDCVDCHPETWDDDDYPVENPWWWPWAVAFLLALAAVAGVVIYNGAPGP